MKLLIINNDNGEGGIWTVIEKLYPALVRLGIAIEMVVLTTNTLFPRVIQSGWSYSHISSPHIPVQLWQLRREIKHIRPDIIMTSELRTNLATLIASIGLPAKVVCCEHSPHHTKYLVRMHKRTSRLDWRWYKLAFLFAFTICVQQFYRFSAKVISPSVAHHRSLKHYTHLPESKLVAIPNPALDGQPPACVPADNPVPVFVASGRLVYQKGYGILLRAFYELLQHMPGKLIILGAGDQTALRVLADKLGIAGHTTFAGHVNNVGEYLRQASVFVCSSRYESASCAIQEALSYGLPVVSTDCPNGPSEILDGGRYGLLVAPDEPTALAEAMMRAARGGAPSSFEERRAYIASQFQADAAAAAYKAVFDAIR